MFDDFSFRKLLFIAALVGGAGWYVRTHVHRPDVLSYAAKQDDHDRRARIRYYVGLSYWLQSQSQPAADIFSQLLADDPTCQYAPKALLHLGEAQTDLRNFSEARAAYEKYIEDFPHGDDITVVQNQYEFVKFK